MIDIFRSIFGDFHQTYTITIADKFGWPKQVALVANLKIWLAISHASSTTIGMMTMDTPGDSSSRFEKSLGLLTTKFVTLLQEAEGGILDLKLVSHSMF